MQKRSSKQAASTSPSGAGDAAVALDTLRALRSDGFVALRVTAGSVTLEVAPTIPTARATSTAPAPRKSIVGEYGGPAIAKLLGDDVEADENGMVPA